METAKAVLSDTAPPLTRYTDDIPLLLQHTIKKMLAKEPDQRYQLIHEVRTNLDELIVISGESEVSAEVAATTPTPRSYLWPVVAGGVVVLVILALALFWPSTVTAPGEPIDSIAILPFENQSDDPELEYLSDGIADSIISSLSQIANLKVMSSSSVRRYKGTNVESQVVAEELGVRAVMKGRILQARDYLSINVELIDTQDNTQLWGEQYERELAEILDVKQAIAQEISEKLRLQLSGEEQKQLAKRGTQNPEAYQDYLRGRYHSNKRNPEELRRGVEYFNKAIDKDSNYAQAYAGLADAYFLQSLFGGRTSSEIYQPALSAAQKALDLDDTLAEAHTAMGKLKGSYEWDWVASEEHLRRAIELNPNHGDALMTYGLHLARQGQLNEGIVELKKAIEVDPLASAYVTQLGRLLMFNRQYDEAIERLQEAVEINPNGTGGRRALVVAYWHNGMYQEAIAGQEAIDSLLGNPDSLWTTLFPEVASGNRVDAIMILENWEGSAPIDKVIWYAMLGKKDLAIEWATKAADERDNELTWAKVNPFFDPIRDDPRFHDLLLRMNLEP
jgi:TolB-like protein/Tfp pilus assembly protein PilF